MGKVLKFPKKFRPGVLSKILHKMESSMTTAISMDRQRGGLKSVANTFAHNRKNINKKFAPYQVTPKTISKAMEKDIGKQGAHGFLMSLTLVQAKQIKKVTNLRRKAGKEAVRQQSALKKIADKSAGRNAQRRTEARAKGVRFIRKNGKIIPIRPKRRKK